MGLLTWSEKHRAPRKGEQLFLTMDDDRSLVEFRSSKNERVRLFTGRQLIMQGASAEFCSAYDVSNSRCVFIAQSDTESHGLLFGFSYVPLTYLYFNCENLELRFEVRSDLPIDDLAAVLARANELCSFGTNLWDELSIA